MNRGRAGTVVLFVVLLSFAAPSAGAKTVEIACGSNPGLLLDKAGTYTIRTAVNSCNSPVMIRISHSDVTLNLGGRMLEGHSLNCLEGIHVNADLKRIAIRNGAIARCDVGIRSEAHGPTVEKVVSFDNNLGFDVKVGKFRTNVVAHSSGTGMTDDSGGSFINNAIVSSGTRAIDSNGTKLIQRNKIIGSGGIGIAGGTGGRIEGNTLYGNGDKGVFLEDGAITGNTAVGNVGTGIDTTGSTLVEGNRAIANNNGFGLLNGIARGNTALANNSFGIIGYHKVLDNRANGNLAYGISAGPSAAVKSNRASGNVGVGIDAFSSTTGVGTNKASRNNDGVAPQCDPAALCVPDPALDGKQIIFLDCSSSFPIDTPGTYVLGASVKDCDEVTAIDISSSDVTLDLAGHRIDGTGVALSSAISIADGLTDVVVRNGTLSQYGFGVIANTTEALIEDVVFTNAVIVGIAAGNGVRVERNVVVRTAGATSAGMILDSGATAIGNSIVANGSFGIRVDGDGVTIRDNYIAGNGDSGIGYDGSFGPTDDNKIIGNQLIGNGWVALRTGNNNTITDNVIKGSIDYPIEAGDGNTIKRNKIIGNSGGINVNANNVITDNVVRSNLGAGIYSESGTIERNKAIGNTGDGIQAGDSVVINDNTAVGNGDNGIDALPGATGSGNVASKNGNPDQCAPDGLGC